MKKWMLITAIMVLNLAWAMPVLADESLFGGGSHSGEESQVSYSGSIRCPYEAANAKKDDSGSVLRPSLGSSDQG